MKNTINNKPCEEVKAVHKEPPTRAPCIAAAAPFSDCNCLNKLGCQVFDGFCYEYLTKGTLPNMFLLPAVASNSTLSAIMVDGVIGKTKLLSTSLKATSAAAKLPSTRRNQEHSVTYTRERGYL